MHLTTRNSNNNTSNPNASLLCYTTHSTMMVSITQFTVQIEAWSVGHRTKEYSVEVCGIYVTRSSATAKSTARPSCLVGVLYDIYRETNNRSTANQPLVYETGHESYRIPEITQNNGHYNVQGRSRSPILVPIESPYATSY